MTELAPIWKWSIGIALAVLLFFGLNAACLPNTTRHDLDALIPLLRIGHTPQDVRRLMKDGPSSVTRGSWGEDIELWGIDDDNTDRSLTLRFINNKLVRVEEVGDELPNGELQKTRLGIPKLVPPTTP